MGTAMAIANSSSKIRQLRFHISTTIAFLALVSITALLLCALYSDSSAVSTNLLLRSISGAAAAVSSTFASLEESQRESQQHQSERIKNCSSSSSSKSLEEIYSKGSWVYDESYPLYQSESCPFIDGGFRCTENGRSDRGYLKWRWQPHCGKNNNSNNLSFPDPKLLLERLRGQRVVFVGDSIGRNQWESLLCMLAQAVERKMDRIVEENGQPISKHTGYLSFRFLDYNCTVEYYRSPFLVPQTRPPKGSPPRVKSVLLLDTMDWTSPKWLGARIIVFNAGHWWNYEKTLRGGCFFAENGKVDEGMQVQEAYSRAIHTWRKWIEHNVDPSKTMVFFRSYSSVHFRNGTWRSGGQCHLETDPVTGPDDEQSRREESWTSRVVRGEIGRLKRPGSIRMLDISPLTDLRKDGHPSLWYRGPGNGPAAKNKQDCSHWCLPGVPDTWNLLLLHLAGLIKREED